MGRLNLPYSPFASEDHILIMDKTTIAFIIGILLVGTFLVFNNLNDNTSGYVVSDQDSENLHELDLAIKDMYCEACAYGVKAQIEEINGVMNADINYRDASGVVKYNADLVSPETIASASTVYPASVIGDRKL